MEGGSKANQVPIDNRSERSGSSSEDERLEDEPLLVLSRTVKEEGGKEKEEKGQVPWHRRVLEDLYGPSLRSNAEHLPRVLYLSALLCCIIGSFWLLDSLKDTVFSTLVGLEHQPKAKVLSVGCTLVLVLYYNSLLDRVETPTMFYILGGGYTVVFGLIAAALGNEFIGMDNVEAHPWRVLGWISYFAIESYGSLAVALFWAFANSTTSLELAEASYGLILAMAQIGAIMGSTVATQVRCLLVVWNTCPW
jgi:AAA family ATP:ADP antiporter